MFKQNIYIYVLLHCVLKLIIKPDFTVGILLFIRKFDNNNLKPKPSIHTCLQFLDGNLIFFAKK